VIGKISAEYVDGLELFNEKEVLSSHHALSWNAYLFTYSKGFSITPVLVTHQSKKKTFWGRVSALRFMVELFSSWQLTSNLLSLMVTFCSVNCIWISRCNYASFFLIPSLILFLLLLLLMPGDMDFSFFWVFHLLSYVICIPALSVLSLSTETWLIISMW
jgi:hypothetical protein